MRDVTHALLAPSPLRALFKHQERTGGNGECETNGEKERGERRRRPSSFERHRIKQRERCREKEGRGGRQEGELAQNKIAPVASLRMPLPAPFFLHDHELVADLHEPLPGLQVDHLLCRLLPALAACLLRLSLRLLGRPLDALPPRWWPLRGQRDRLHDAAAAPLRSLEESLSGTLDSGHAGALRGAHTGAGSAWLCRGWRHRGQNELDGLDLGRATGTSDGTCDCRSGGGSSSRGDGGGGWRFGVRAGGSGCHPGSLLGAFGGWDVGRNPRTCYLVAPAADGLGSASFFLQGRGRGGCGGGRGGGGGGGTGGSGSGGRERFVPGEGKRRGLVGGEVRDRTLQLLQAGRRGRGATEVE